MRELDLHGLREQLAAAITERLADVVDRVVELGRDLPGYEAARPEDRRAEVDGLVRVGLELWRHDAPISAMLEPWSAVMATRQAQGVPLASVLRAVLVAEEELLSVAAEITAAHLVDAGILHEYATWLMRLAVALSAASVEMFGGAGSTDEHHADRAEFWADVFSGRLSGLTLNARARQLGLDAQRRYVAFRARGAPTTMSPFGVVLAHVDGDVAGVATNASLLESPGAIIGVGTAVVLASLPTSFAEATRALDVAVALGLAGVHTLDGLGARVGVVALPDVGDRLIRRYLEPLEQLGRFGEDVLEAVQVFLDNDRQFQQAAHALGVHYNTLRHRLRRFEEITGAELGRHATSVEVWWAVEARRLRHRDRMRT